MKLSKSKYHYVPTIAGFLYIILFVYASLNKFLDFNNFQVQLGQSPVLTAYADWISWGIPIIELIIAGLFIFSKYTLLAFYVSFSLMIMFTTYIIVILNFSDFIPCSCGGVLEKLSWTDHIIFNLVFIAIAVVGIQFSDMQLNVKREAI